VIFVDVRRRTAPDTGRLCPLIAGSCRPVYGNCRPEADLWKLKICRPVAGAGSNCTPAPQVLELRNNLVFGSNPASLPFCLYASAQQDRAKTSKQRFGYKPFFYTERGHAACALTFIERDDHESVRALVPHLPPDVHSHALLLMRSTRPPGRVFFCRSWKSFRVPDWHEMKLPKSGRLLRPTASGGSSCHGHLTQCVSKEFH
jgi:hypothetical protein